MVGNGNGRPDENPRTDHHDGSGTDPGPIPDTSVGGDVDGSDAGVATAPPIEELDAGLDPQRFGWFEVLRRVDQADPWADYFRIKQALTQPRLRKLSLVEGRPRARERGVEGRPRARERRTERV